MTEAIQPSMYILIVIFIGTLSGGMAASLISKIYHKNYLYLTVFCGGILAGILGFELVPELMRSYQPIGIMAGISTGIFIMFLLERFLHRYKHVQTEQSETFTLLFLALLIHSIPTGLALGMDMQKHHLQDSALLGAILFHHIPEGMVMMVSVMYSKKKLKAFWIFCFLLSLAVGINTYFGYLLDFHSLKLRTLFIGVAIGTLSYVTFYEILWKGFKKQANIKMLLAVLLGIVFLKIYLALIPFDH